MGTWGTGLYQDDTTCDIKEEYLNLLKIGKEPKEAMEEMIINWEECIEDVEEGPLFWFALAETQWKYGLLDEKVKDHKWYKKYVLLKMAGTRKSNIGSLPREIYYNEYDLLSLYNWIGNKEIDIEKIDNLKIIFLEEENVYEPIVTIVGDYFLEKRNLKKINAKVIKNDMKNLYTDEVRKKYPRYHGHNINNFDTTIIKALEREEKRGNLVKDFEE